MSDDIAPDRIKSFRVPDLGEGLEEVTVLYWNIDVGDDVELNEILCSVETAKAEVEIPSPYAGRVVEKCGADGDVLQVGAALVRIDTAPLSGDLHGEMSSRLGNDEFVPPTLVGYGADADIDTSRRQNRPLAAPPVRQLAKELRVDLASLRRGVDKVVTRGDVLAAAETSGPEVRPVRGVQARMAEKMTLSHREIPAAKVSVEVECAELLRLRDRLRSVVPEITPFLLTLRLLVIALIHNKILNSTWVDSPQGPQVHVHRGVHLGFGVATKRGLLVPVIADAQDMTTRELVSRTVELISGAHAGSLTPGELQGSTFTVTNFGALAVDDGVPVINYPEAAILGMGAIKPRPMVVDGGVVVQPSMVLACVFDHRVADGAQVAQFLCALRDLIESPETALLEL